jgi:hypothetical protein
MDLRWLDHHGVTLGGSLFADMIAESVSVKRRSKMVSRKGAKVPRSIQDFAALRETSKRFTKGMTSRLSIMTWDFLTADMTLMRR